MDFLFSSVQLHYAINRKNKKRIEEYIKNQLQQDQIADQMSLKEFVDPFTGSKNTKA